MGLYTNALKITVSTSTSTEAVAGSPGWAGSRAAEGSPGGEELRTGAEGIPVEEEDHLRMEAGSTPAGGMQGWLEGWGIPPGSCCRGCSRQGEECRAGRGEAWRGWAGQGRAEGRELQRTGWLKVIIS